MSKEQAVSTLDPTFMVLGAPVFAEHGQAVIKQANWTFGNRPMMHISQMTGKRTGGAASTPSSLALEFRATSAGSVEVLRFYIKILPETVTLTAGAECYLAGGAGSVKFTIGSSSQTITYTLSDSGTEKTVSFSSGATGVDWQLCTIELEKTSGTSDMHLSNFRIQDDVVISSLPDPILEGDNETVDVQEEGSAVVLSARKLNFIGADITASDAGLGVANVTVSSSGGGGALTVSAVSAATVTAAADTYYIVDSSSNAVAINLPAAATAGTGARIAVKARTGASNTVTIDSNGGELIDDSTSSLLLTTDQARVQVTCDGSGWWID